MSEAYSRLYHSSVISIAEGSPVAVEACAILSDNSTSELIAQLKLYNLSEKPVKLARVELSFLDAVGRPVGAPISHLYVDFLAGRGERFGTQSPILVPYPEARSLSVKVVEVGFEDNTLWECTAAKSASTDGGTVGLSIEKAPIGESLGSPEAHRAYKRRFGESAEYAAKKFPTVWLCTCGEINHENESSCYKCGAVLTELLSFDPAAEEREERYLRANKLLNESTTARIHEARKLFSSLSGYKDSDELVKDCDLKIAERNKDMERIRKRLRKRVLTSVILVAVIALSVVGYKLIKPLIASSSGSYSDYINMYGITEFEIPHGVTEIENHAFIDCPTLEKVIIPDTVTRIGSQAFQYCTNLKSVNVPDSVTEIGNAAFSGCTSLESIVIGNGVTFVGHWAFDGCVKLSSMTLGESVTRLGTGAFRDCSSLTSIVIPDSVTTIEEYAFDGCHGVNEITVGSGVTSIENDAFASFGNADTRLNISSIEAWLNISFANGSSTPANFSFSVYCNGELLTDLIIPDGVTHINAYAFRDFRSITSVTIPASLKSIGTQAFDGAFDWSNPQSVYISDLASWCNIDFADAQANPILGAYDIYLNDELIEHLVIPESVTEIKDYAFAWWHGLKSFEMHDGVTAIGKDAFNGCNSLASVIIPDGVESIGDNAFANCNYTELRFGANLSSIGESAFSLLYVQHIRVSEDNPVFCAIEDTLYSKDGRELILSAGGKNDREFRVPDGVTAIRAYAFSNNKNIERVVISDSVEVIGAHAFNGCTSLHSVVLPSGLTRIENFTFSRCTNLVDIDIPYGVTSIGEYAFNQSGITEIAIPQSVTSIENYAFDYCENLTSVVIPDSVTSVGAGTFSSCYGLVSATLGSGMTSISNSMFSFCTALESVYIPESITYIDNWAFENCTALTEFVMPNTVTRIGAGVFSDCSSLVSITLSANLTKIDGHNFNNCTSLTSIVIPASLTNISYATFRGCTALVSIVFEDSNGWGAYTNDYVVIGESINVSDPQNAAELLKNTYCEYYIRK